MIFRFIGNKIADTVLYPVDQPFPKTPADYGIEYKDEEFLARDGVKLSAWLLNETASKVKTIPTGAATSVYAATAPELEGRGGIYLDDCQIAAVNDDESAPGGVRSYALDPEAAKRLWAVSEEMVGQSFPV